MRHVIVSWLAVLVFCLCPALVSAQTPIVNPSAVTFAASSDHVTNVNSYVVEVNRITGTPIGLVASVDIGKPTPVGPDITSSLPALVGPLPSCTGPTDACYTVTVVTKNGFGATRSAASDPFSHGSPPAAPGRPVLK